MAPEIPSSTTPSYSPGYTSSVDASEGIDEVIATKADPKDSRADQLLKALKVEEERVSRQPGAPTTRFGNIEIADAASDTIQAGTEAANPEAKADEVKPEVDQKAQGHLVGGDKIDGQEKGLLKTLADLSGVNIGDLNQLEAGKTLENQAPGTLSDEQLKNLTEMIDSLNDPARSGPYLAKIKANHDQNLADQLKQRDDRIQRLEQAKQANDPALIKQIQSENQKFAQRLMNDMERLKMWEESQKFKNAQLAATLAAIHDSIKLAASVQ